MKKILVSCLASALLAVSAGASAEPQQPDASNFNLTFAVELDREGRITGLEPQPGACRRAPAHGGAQALGLASDRWRHHLHRPPAGVLQQRGHPAQGQGHQRHAAALKAVRGRLQA